MNTKFVTIKKAVLLISFVIFSTQAPAGPRDWLALPNLSTFQWTNTCTKFDGFKSMPTNFGNFFAQKIETIPYLNVLGKKIQEYPTTTLLAATGLVTGLGLWAGFKFYKTRAIKKNLDAADEWFKKEELKKQKDFLNNKIQRFKQIFGTQNNVQRLTENKKSELIDNSMKQENNSSNKNPDKKNPEVTFYGGGAYEYNSETNDIESTFNKNEYPKHEIISLNSFINNNNSSDSNANNSPITSPVSNSPSITHIKDKKQELLDDPNLKGIHELIDNTQLIAWEKWENPLNIFQNQIDTDNVPQLNIQHKNIPATKQIYKSLHSLFSLIDGLFKKYSVTSIVTYNNKVGTIERENVNLVPVWITTTCEDNIAKTTRRFSAQISKSALQSLRMQLKQIKNEVLDKKKVKVDIQKELTKTAARTILTQIELRIKVLEQLRTNNLSAPEEIDLTECNNTLGKIAIAFKKALDSYTN